MVLTGVAKHGAQRTATPARALWLNPQQVGRLVERYREGSTVYDLASEFGVARTTVSKQLKAAGVNLRCGPLSEAEIARATELYLTGVSLVAVGAQLGRHHSGIWRALKAAGIPRRDFHGRERSS